MTEERSAKALGAVLVALAVVLAVLTYVVVLGGFRFGGVAPPGAATLDYLQGDPYANLVVEVDYVAGREPEGETRDLLGTRLRQHTDKATVLVLLDTVVPAGDGRYSLQEVLGIEQAHRGRRTGGSMAVLYLLFLDGVFDDPDVEGAESALGVAYTASSVVVFKDRIAEVTGGSGPFRSGLELVDVEGAVVVHELGHVFGLVNLVYESDLDYEDPDHPGHSRNESCVMYWAIEATPIGSVFGEADPPPNDFGSEARYDLEQLKAGAYRLTFRIVAGPAPPLLAAPAAPRGPLPAR